jgi:hypothetical protein
MHFAIKKSLWLGISLCVGLVIVLGYLHSKSDLGSSDQKSSPTSDYAVAKGDSTHTPLNAATSNSSPPHRDQPASYATPRTSSAAPKSVHQKELSYFLNFETPDANASAVSDSVAALGGAKAVRSFGPGENPSAPSCYKGDFRSEETGVIYDVLFELMADGTPDGQVPGTPWMSAWKVGAGFASVSSNEGEHWETSLRNNSKFLEVNDSVAGFFVPVSDAVTLQLFPKVRGAHRFEYLGNVYMNLPEKGVKKVGEINLKAVEMGTCLSAQSKE